MGKHSKDHKETEKKKKPKKETKPKKCKKGKTRDDEEKSIEKTLEASVDNDEVPQKPKQSTASKDSHLHRARLLAEERDQNLPYSLLGPEMYAPEEELEQVVQQAVGRKFIPGDIVEGFRGRYAIKQALGNRIYLAAPIELFKRPFSQNVVAPKFVVMKTESLKVPLEGPVLQRESLFFKHADLETTFNTHFPRFHDHAQNKNDPAYFALFISKAEFTLEEVRSTRLNDAEFLPQTAVRLCMETLQAIHDVHQVQCTHRNIQPKNFMIDGVNDKGLSHIFISGFEVAYDLRRTDVSLGFPATLRVVKMPSHSQVFQSRAYHRFAEMKDPLTDMESWIYMCYDFFNSKALPWKQKFDTPLKERNYLNFKKSFFNGVFDLYFDSLGIPPLLHVLRREIGQTKVGEQIDYPYLGQILNKVASDLKVNWSEIYEWQKVSNKKPHSGAIDANANDGQVDCVTQEETSDASPLQKKSVEKKKQNGAVDAKKQSSNVAGNGTSQFANTPSYFALPDQQLPGLDFADPYD